MLYFWRSHGPPSFHELLITLFLFLTAPITALMLAKANLLRRKREASQLPPTGRPVGWATLEGARED